MAAPRPLPLVIGSAELVDIPCFGIRGLRARVDTGARTSALHVENIRRRPGGRVRFDVRLHRTRPERRVTVEAQVRREGQVRSSSGFSEVRTFVAVRIRIGAVARTIEVGLVDRSRMVYRMLLGRSALAGFLVDPSRRYLLGRRVFEPGSSAAPDSGRPETIRRRASPAEPRALAVARRRA
jgi:hypothetical protein